MVLIATLTLVALLQQSVGVVNLGARTLVADAMSNIDEPRQAVARTQAEWDALWRLHAGDQPAPPVDFKTEMVAAIFLGSKPTPGYSAHIIRGTIAGKTVTYQWIERRPERGTILAQVLTSPALFVAIPRVDGEVKFEQVAPRD